MNMAWVQVILVLVSVSLTLGQRGSFAGTKPIGFPELLNRTTTTADGLGDRFGADDATTQKLPLEALGDKDLVDRLSQLPEDHQSFWLLNSQALEAHRQKPQVYPQKPSGFAQNLNTLFQNQNQNVNPGLNGNTGSSGVASGFGGPQNVNSGVNGNSGSSGVAPDFVGNSGLGLPVQPSSQNFNAPLNVNNNPPFTNTFVPNSPSSGVQNSRPQNFGVPNNVNNQQGNRNPGFFPGNQGSRFTGNMNRAPSNQNIGFNSNPGVTVGNRNGEIPYDSMASHEDKSKMKSH